MASVLDSDHRLSSRCVASTVQDPEETIITESSAIRMRKGLKKISLKLLIKYFIKWWNRIGQVSKKILPIEAVPIVEFQAHFNGFFADYEPSRP